MKMWLVVARGATGTTVGSEATTTMALEATKQSAEDRATAAQSTVAARLALAEAEIEKLRAAAVSANEAEDRSV
jgi:bifunctional ADP-heptose synthase (sugar kinase/adenylyltransferase)